MVRYGDLMANKTMPPLGSRVGVRFGSGIAVAVLVEDRGVFGDKHIVKVRLGERGDPEDFDFELPVDELYPPPPPSADEDL